MTSIDALKKRTDRLAPANNTVYYRIDAITDTFSERKSTVYRTADEAMQGVYADAKKRHANLIHVIVFPYWKDMRGNFLGFVWEKEKVSCYTVPKELEDVSTFYTLCDCFLGRMDKISYPKEHPEFEILELLEQRELEWCIDVGYSSIEDYKAHHRKENPNFYTDEYETDLDMLKRIYREAGYHIL